MPFFCDAGKLIPGDLVLMEAPIGPAGRATYPHFFVIVYLPELIKVGAAIPCLGITSRTSDERFNPEQHMKLPWLNRKGGHPSTGLDRPSIVKVTFRHVLIVKPGDSFPLEVAARHRGHFIPSRDFQALTAMANAYNRKLILEGRGRPPSAGDEPGWR